MGRMKIEVEVLECDSCQAQVIFDDETDVAGWFTGTVTFFQKDPYKDVEWAACKPAHIKNAILSVTEQL